jgi:tetratricopeptide (TPR) repeat protein
MSVVQPGCLYASRRRRRNIRRPHLDFGLGGVIELPLAPKVEALMIPTSPPGRVFVGRTEQRTLFRETVEDFFQAADQRPARATNQARLLLFQGSGGMGKTELLYRFEAISKGAARELGWVMVDWEVEREAAALPANLPGMLMRLYKACAEQLGSDVHKHFKSLRTADEEYRRVDSKIAKASSGFQRVIPSLADYSALGTEMTGSLFLGSAGGKLVGAAAKVGVQALGEGLDSLRRYLSEPDFDLYTNSDTRYSTAFAQSLVSLAADRPVLLVQDSYEIIANSGPLDSRWRLLTSNVLRLSSRVGFISACRTDLTDDYTKAFAFMPHRLRVERLGPFALKDTRKLVAAYGLPSHLAEDIQRNALGVPLVTNAVAQLLKNGGPEVISRGSEFVEKFTSDRDVLQQTIDRFMRYVIARREDTSEVARRKLSARYEIWTLALLRTYDSNALAACWSALGGGKVELMDVALRLAELRKENEFLFEEGRDRMQKEVRHFIRAYLRQQVEPSSGSLERDLILKANKAALQYYEATLLDREGSLSTISERVEDPLWRSLCLNVLNHKFWQDERDGVRDWVRRVIETGNTQESWLTELVSIAREANPRDTGLVRIVEGGVQSLLSEQPDLPVLEKMWSELKNRGDNLKLQPVHRALVSYHRGRVLNALGKPLDAAREFEQSLQAIPPDHETSLRPAAIKGLVGSSALLLLETRDYRQAISVAEQVLKHEAGNVQAEQFQVMSLMGLKEYDRAGSLVDDLIRQRPDVMDFRWARQLLYRIQGRETEALEELRETARLHPDFIQDLIAKITDAFKDSGMQKALTQWGEDAGWIAGPMAAKIYDLPPDVAVEVITTSMEAMTTENPTARQVLKLRERLAQLLPDWYETQLELGVSYLRAGRLQEALGAFERAHEIAPDKPITATVPAIILFQTGHETEGELYVTRSIQLLPDSPGPSVMLIGHYLETRRLDELKVLLPETLNRFPNDGMLLLMNGLFIAALGEPEKGLMAQKEAYRSHPEVLDFFAKGIRALSPVALEKLKERLKNDLPQDIGEVLLSLDFNDFVRLHIELLRANLEGDDSGSDKPEVVIPILRELLMHKPDSTDLSLRLARVYARTEDAASEIQILSDTIGRLDAAAGEDARRRLILLYIKSRQLNAAIEQVDLLPKPLGAKELYLLAELYAAAGRSDAVDLYDQAMALMDDDDPDRRIRLARYNIAVGRLERGEELLRLLIEKRPDDSEAHDTLGDVLLQQNRSSEAIVVLQKAMELNPASPIPAARLARHYRLASAPEEAAVYMKKATTDVNSLDAYNQACVFAQLGMKDEAVSSLEKALLENPDQRSWAAIDPDLRDLHGDPAFRKLVAHGAAAVDQTDPGDNRATGANS